MIEIAKTVAGEERVFKVYTKVEAEAKGIEFVYWKDAGPGQWCVSDDDYVAECIRRNGPYYDKNGKRKRFEIAVAYGRRFTNAPLRFSIAGQTRHWTEREAALTRTKIAIKAYVRLLVEKEGSLTQEDFTRLGLLYRKDQARPDASFKRLLRQKTIQDMVANELEELLSKHGVTASSVIEGYADLRQRARDGKKHNIELAVLDRFKEMLAMQPEKREQEQEIVVEWNHLSEGDETPQIEAPKDEFIAEEGIEITRATPTPLRSL
jgi:hypothetical protein